MKKIFIILGTIIVVGIVLFIILILTGSSGFYSKLDKIKTRFLEEHQDSKIMDIKAYYGTKTYYIVNHKNTKDQFVTVLNYDGSEAYTVENDKLCKLSDEVKNIAKIGYENLQIVYEVIEKDQKNIYYIYYNALTCKMIDEIKIKK